MFQNITQIVKNNLFLEKDANGQETELHELCPKDDDHGIILE